VVVTDLDVAASDLQAVRGAALRTRRQESPAAHRHRTGQVPARVRQARRVPAVHGAAPGRKSGRMASGVARPERHARSLRAGCRIAAMSVGAAAARAHGCGATSTWAGGRSLGRAGTGKQVWPALDAGFEDSSTRPALNASVSCSLATSTAGKLTPGAIARCQAVIRPGA